MKRKITIYIKGFFDYLSHSHQKQLDYSQEIVPFDQSGLFSKITDAIESKERNIKTIPVYKRGWFLVASSVCIIIFGYYYFTHVMQKNMIQDNVWITKTTGQDKIDSVTLSDGTKVWLNINSSIRYPQHFNARTREVSLKGEAFFDVKHNPKSPFIIHSETIRTTVLGTSLDVNAYQNNSVINVTVKTGKVQVVENKASENKYMITPRQQLSIHKKSHVISLKKEINLVTTIGWKKNKLIFEDKPLKDIIPLINKRYDTSIQIDSSLNNFEITANFDNESLDNILKVLCIITNQKITKKNGLIYLENQQPSE